MALESHRAHDVLGSKGSTAANNPFINLNSSDHRRTDAHWGARTEAIRLEFVCLFVSRTEYLKWEYGTNCPGGAGWCKSGSDGVCKGRGRERLLQRDISGYTTEREGRGTRDVRPQGTAKFKLLLLKTISVTERILHRILKNYLASPTETKALKMLAIPRNNRRDLFSYHNFFAF